MSLDHIYGDFLHAENLHLLLSEFLFVTIPSGATLEEAHVEERSKGDTYLSLSHTMRWIIDLFTWPLVPRQIRSVTTG